MDQTTCHHCNQPVTLVLVEGELVMESHHDGDELCGGSGERPVSQREITD